jgi:chemotaxis protein methyltransferase CheR
MRVAGAQSSPPAIAAISPQEFALWQAYIERESGIHLVASKTALLAARLSKRLRALGLASFSDYYQEVQLNPGERTRMLDAISTNETHFFREPCHYRFLEEELFTRWRKEAARGDRDSRIRIWSAACATGEEPFSIAMLLAHHFPPLSGWDTQVMATDLSHTALAQARSATWSIERMTEIPPRLLKRHMLRGVGDQAGRMRARAELRRLVRFAELNLCGAGEPLGGPFDAIFLCNVLIYFQPTQRARIVGRVIRHLRRGGQLFLGHAETLSDLSELSRTGVWAIYTKVRREQ